MRVRYEYLADDGEFELQKWRLADKAFSEADVQVLQGLKRAQAVREVQALLRSQGRPDTPEGLSKFFSEGGIKSMSPTVIGRMLKIAERFEQSGSDAALLVTELDSQFGCAGHALGHHSNLSLVCQRTVVKKNEPVQNQLFLWVLETVRDEIQGQKVDANMGQPALQILITRALLKRRVVHYLARKYGQKDGPLLANLTSLPSFKACGLDQSVPSSLAWLSALPDHEQQVASFAARIIRGTAEIDGLMDELLKKDSLLAPEATAADLRTCKAGSVKGKLEPPRTEVAPWESKTPVLLSRLAPEWTLRVPKRPFWTNSLSEGRRPILFLFRAPCR